MTMRVRGQSRQIGMVHVLGWTSLLASVVATAPVARGSPPTVGFGPETSYELSSSQPHRVVVEYVDGDTHADLVVTCTGGIDGIGAVTVQFGDGLGGFLQSDDIDVGGSPWGLAVDHFNSDNELDLAVTLGGNEVTDVRIFLGAGEGTFVPGVVLTAGRFPIGVVARDFNGDGDTDLAVANNVLYGLTVFLGNGDGTFGSGEHVTDASGFRATDIAVGHLNADNHLDLALSHYGGVLLLAGAGDGTFTTLAYVGSSVLTEAVALGDVNADGAADVASVEVYGGNLLLNLGNGDGTFQTAQPYSVGSFCRDVLINDINLDGLADVTLAYQDGNQVKVMLSSGCGTLMPALDFATGVQPFAVASGDWNEDGYPDLAVPYRNLGDTAFTSILLQLPPSPVIPGDADGDADVDADDLTLFEDCMAGPGIQPDPTLLECAVQCLEVFDFDGDVDVDCDDWAAFREAWTELDGPPDLPACFDATVPSVSTWGLILMMLTLVTSGTLILARRRGDSHLALPGVSQ